ncbi:hypothetical protein GCM10022221_64560 [Actinocorallia aurea]
MAARVRAEERGAGARVPDAEKDAVRVLDAAEVEAEFRSGGGLDGVHEQF